MVKNKGKIKQKRVINEDMTNVRNMIILLNIVIGVCIGIYYLTEYMINKDSNNVVDSKEVIIDYDIATIGTMFNRVEDEYYVLLYSSKDNGADLNNILSTYRSSDNYLKTYYIDLDKKINEIALGEETVKKPKSPNDVKVIGATLYKIKDGKVNNCYIGIDEIIEILK